MEHDQDDALLREWLLGDMAETAKRMGYTPTRFIQMVQEFGAVNACKRLLNKGIPYSEGFCRLLAIGLIDWSVESIAVSGQWGHLFTEEEKQVARFRLDKAKTLCADKSLRGR